MAESLQNSFFDTEYLKTDLKGRSIRGGAATISAQGVKFLLHIGSTVVLARLLAPQDFGLIAMVAVVTNFVRIFKDIGLSTATIQRAEINHAQISTLFWINTTIGFALAVLTVALAPAIAWFYGEPRLTVVTIALAGAFIFGGLTIQHQALLRRHMRFVRLGVIEVVGLLVGVATAIVAAWRGAGYWSLVLMQLAMAGTIAIGVWAASGWRPGWPCRRSGVSSMLVFGRNIVGFRMINYFARNSDKILVGRFCGSGILGLYSKAYNLLMLPISQIRGPLNAVAMPALSRIQKDPARYRSYFSKLTSLLSLVSMPLMIFMVVCADNAVRIVLGEKWSGAGILFKIMAITGFIQTPAGVRSLVLLSYGRSGRYLKFGMFNSIATVASFIIGLPWGATGVAVSYAIANYLILFPSLWYCFRLTPVSTMTFLRAVSRPMIASVCMGAVIFTVYLFIANQPDIIVVGTCFLIGLLAYLSVLILIPGGVQMLREFSSYMLIVLRKQS